MTDREDSEKIVKVSLEREDQTDKEFVKIYSGIIQLIEAHASLFVSPVAVAFSGGADSTFLLYTLSQAFKKIGKSLHDIVAIYVDHGWRPESREEALYLRDIATSIGVSYLSVKISEQKITSLTSNIEESLRVERYRLLFRECVARQISCLLIGHHADDQIEVIFKRMLEGSSLQAFKGMGLIEAFPLALRDNDSYSNNIATDVLLIRPLLCVQKEFIIKWLNKNSISYLHDSTNQDVTYLRNRLRHTIFPFLKKEFGKQIEAPFLRISEEARRLHAYILSVAPSRILQRKGKKIFYLESVYDPSGQDDAFLVEQLLFILKKEYPALSLFSRQQIIDASQIFVRDQKNRDPKWFFAGNRSALISQYGRIIFLSSCIAISHSKQIKDNAEHVVIETGCSQKRMIYDNEWEIAIQESPVDCFLAQKKHTRNPIWFSLLDGEHISFTVDVDDMQKITMRSIRMSDAFLHSHKLLAWDIEHSYERHAPKKFSLLRRLLPALLINDKYIVALSELTSDVINSDVLRAIYGSKSRTVDNYRQIVISIKRLL